MGAVLLTGATGFVGMELLQPLLPGGDGHIHALVRAPTIEPQPAGCRLIRG